MAWFTGFYEGEGYVSNDISNRNRLRMGISQNDKTPLEIGQKIWGGSLRKRVKKSPASDKICTSYEWSLNHNDSLNFIEDIKSFMIIPYKIQQLEKCLYIFKNEKWDRRFKCNFCEKDFADMPGRRRHENKEHVEKGKMFKCEIENCNKTYKSRDSMKRHIRLNHKSDTSHDSGDTPYNVRETP